jgi:hypothetical protein
MNARVLQAFLIGTTPNPKTRGETVVERATAALRVLLRDLPPSREACWSGRVVAFLEDLYDAESAPRPFWLAELRARLGTNPEQARSHRERAQRGDTE